MKASIIIPVYNAGDTIKEVVERVSAVELGPGWTKELIIINDGSNDHTRAVLEELAGAAREDPIVLFHNEKNMGKGCAVRLGYQMARGDVCIIQDADLELNPDDIPLLLEPLRDPSVNVVYGKRDFHAPQISRFHRWANIFLSRLTSMVYGARIGDVETCYKALRKTLLDRLRFESRGFEIEVEVTAKILRLHEPILEVPVQYFPRTKSEGKKIHFSDGLKAIFCMLKYRFARKRSFLLGRPSRR